MRVLMIAKASVGECKIVITFSDPSWPERLPLCFGYESETSRLPHGVIANLSFIANRRGEGHWRNGQMLRGKTQVSMWWGGQRMLSLAQQMTAFLYVNRSI